MEAALDAALGGLAMMVVLGTLFGVAMIVRDLRRVADEVLAPDQPTRTADAVLVPDEPTEGSRDHKLPHRH